MRNADNPAMPQTEYQHNDAGEYIAETRGGLTKREHFAALAMQALLSCTATEGPPEDIARAAVLNADALLAELERTT